MTGIVPAVLSEAEMKSIMTLVTRFPWNVAKPIISALGLARGKGRDATHLKIIEELASLKERNVDKFEEIIKSINNLIFGQMVYGDKAFFSLKVHESVISKLTKVLNFDWDVASHPESVSDVILSEQDIINSNKNGLDVIHYSESDEQSLVLFSSVREQKIREKISPKNIPEYSNYDEIIATKKEKLQCFDVCIFDKINSSIHVLIDAGNNIAGESLLFAKGTVIRELYNIAGFGFESEERDFFSLIEPIFKQEEKPFSLLEYKVFELSFLTPEGTTHKEKKNDSNKDLRHDIFNLEGIKAVGNIGLYRIGIRVERENPLLQLADNVELIIPGTLRRYLHGSAGTPINFAILSKCISREDFETLTKLIL
ncbi:hypothetical protein [Pantoea sp. SOD02]|uniref:hypothetical protein n=1 Tax=Pantoea sp. SOD02 TaxID=2970818 RepID=UPI0021572CD1|nr:hypothetical protein [Pantoea sp. SOD02]UVC28834.1 hypothetical protein NR302_16580 [Pantoea sp. SOD02]